MSDKLAKDVSVLVLAGGFGTRVRHLFPDTPKPLMPILGQPFLTWLLESIRHQGFKKVYLLAHFLSSELLDYCESYCGDDLLLEVIVEPEPLGTGGAIAHALFQQPDISDEFIVMNGDTIFRSDLMSLIRARADGADIGMTGMYVDNADRFGTMVLNELDQLVAFKEKGQQTGLVNLGVYGLDRSIFERLSFTSGNFSFEQDFLPAALAAGMHISVERTESEFLDIGTEESFKNSGEFMNRNFAHLKRRLGA